MAACSHRRLKAKDHQVLTLAFRNLDLASGPRGAFACLHEALALVNTEALLQMLVLRFTAVPSVKKWTGCVTRNCGTECKPSMVVKRLDNKAGPLLSLLCERAD